ncbi:ABC transporter ATP-binding protein [Rhodococcus sp. NPDC078407]|uniref:ABC transporter ATP-binding protein n=1 Tax=Rhodococcus sp. NPDC078407 TaxID=3364509 RepID=UPI0037C8006B
MVENTMTLPTPASAPPTSDAAVEVKGLSMKYGNRTVVDDIDFTIGRGEVVAVLGPNGAGKSTTIEVLEGFRRPSAGRVSVLGCDPATADEQWRSRVGVVLQSWRDHGKWRVREFLDYTAAAHRAIGREPRDVDALVETVGLSGLEGRRIDKLSGGQRRRVDVAVGVIGRPEVLFLDEPTSGFDPEVKLAFGRMIGDLAVGTTVILATHDLSEAQRLADRIVMLAGGRVVAYGTSEELRNKFARGVRVRWTSDGEARESIVDEEVPFVRELLTGPDCHRVANLEVTHGSLEDVYMSIVRSQQDAIADAAIQEKGNLR